MNLLLPLEVVNRVGRSPPDKVLRFFPAMFSSPSNIFVCATYSVMWPDLCKELLFIVSSFANGLDETLVNTYTNTFLVCKTWLQTLMPYYEQRYSFVFNTWFFGKQTILTRPTLCHPSSILVSPRVKAYLSGLRYDMQTTEKLLLHQATNTLVSHCPSTKHIFNLGTPSITWLKQCLNESGPVLHISLAAIGGICGMDTSPYLDDIAHLVTQYPSKISIWLYFCESHNFSLSGDLLTSVVGMTLASWDANPNLLTETIWDIVNQEQHPVGVLLGSRKERLSQLVVLFFELLSQDPAHSWQRQLHNSRFRLFFENLILSCYYVTDDFWTQFAHLLHFVDFGSSRLREIAPSFLSHYLKFRHSRSASLSTDYLYIRYNNDLYTRFTDFGGVAPGCCSTCETLYSGMDILSSRFEVEKVDCEWSLLFFNFPQVPFHELMQFFSDLSWTGNDLIKRNSIKMVIFHYCKHLDPRKLNQRSDVILFAALGWPYVNLLKQCLNECSPVYSRLVRRFMISLAQMLHRFNHHTANEYKGLRIGLKQLLLLLDQDLTLQEIALLPNAPTWLLDATVDLSASDGELIRTSDLRPPRFSKKKRALSSPKTQKKRGTKRTKVVTPKFATKMFVGESPVDAWF